MEITLIICVTIIVIISIITTYNYKLNYKKAETKSRECTYKDDIYKIKSLLAFSPIPFVDPDDPNRDIDKLTKANLYRILAEIQDIVG